jgi:FkbM family methyltransferase
MVYKKKLKMALKLNHLKEKNNLKINGIIHIGIHWGEEHESYIEMDVKNLLYYEADPNNYQVCKEYIKNIKSDASVKLINMALGDTNDIMEFNISSNDSESSSFLKPKKHLNQYPWIHFSKKIEIQLNRLDDIIEDSELYNTIVIDVQGFELNVLRGGFETLKKIDYIMTEINVDETYEGCCLVSELDSFLSTFGFERIETELCGSTWGDALYIKK